MGVSWHGMIVDRSASFRISSLTGAGPSFGMADLGMEGLTKFFGS